MLRHTNCMPSLAASARPRGGGRADDYDNHLTGIKSQIATCPDFFRPLDLPRLYWSFITETLALALLLAVPLCPLAWAIVGVWLN